MPSYLRQPSPTYAPIRPASAALILPGVRTHHLSYCRKRAGEPLVGRPRHLLAYHVREDGAVVPRVLHDAMELEEQLRG